MRIRFVIRPSPHTGKVIVAIGVFELALWIAIALMFTVYRDEPGAVAFLRNFIYLAPRLGPPVVMLAVCWIAHRAVADPHSDLSKKLAAHALAAAGSSRPGLGVSVLGLWLLSVVLITMSSHEPTPLAALQTALQTFVYVGLWLWMPVFVLLTAGFAIRANAMRSQSQRDAGEGAAEQS